MAEVGATLATPRPRPLALPRGLASPQGWTLAALALIVGVLCFAPFARLVAEGFLVEGGLGIERLVRVWSQPAAERALVNTVGIAAGSALLAGAIGTALAAIVALTDIRAKRALVFCFILPMMVPPQVAALAWLQAFGPASPFLGALGLAPEPGTPHPLHSGPGIVLLLGFYNAPLVFLAVRASLRSLPSDLVEAARAAGAGTWTVIRTIVAPLAAGGIVSGAALAFVSAAGNFGIQAMLGIPARLPTLTTLVYQRLSGYGPSVLGDVAALSLGLAAIAVAGLVFQAWFLRRRDLRVTGRTDAATLELGSARPLVEAAVWGFVLAVLAVPVAALLSAALVRGYGLPLNAETLTFKHFATALFEHASIRAAFLSSLWLAAATAVTLAAVALPLAYLVAWQRSPVARLLGAAAELSYAMPGIIAAIAAILLFLRPLPLVGVSLYGTAWLILIAYVGHYLPLMLRPVIGGLKQVDPSLEEAARVAGAGFFRRLVDVLLPLLAPMAAAGGILIFLTALNEMQISILLVNSSTRTIGTVVYTLEEAGSSSLAAAVGVLIVLAVLVLMLVATLIGRRLPRGVLPWEP